MGYIMNLACYFFSFVACLYALSAVDFNKFLKKNRPAQAQALYLILAMALAYLLGRFILSITYKTFML